MLPGLGWTALQRKTISSGKKINDEPPHCCKGWQKKRKLQDVRYTLASVTNQVSAVIALEMKSWTGACRSGTLPYRLLGSERAEQETEAQLAEGGEPEAMDCHWGREACSKLSRNSSHVCLREISPPWQVRGLWWCKELSLLRWLLLNHMLLQWPETLDWAFGKEAKSLSPSPV